MPPKQYLTIATLAPARAQISLTETGAAHPLVEQLVGGVEEPFARRVGATDATGRRR